MCANLRRNYKKRDIDWEKDREKYKKLLQQNGMKKKEVHKEIIKWLAWNRNKKQVIKKNTAVIYVKNS